MRRPRGAQFEFTLAAIAQNLRRLAKLVAPTSPERANRVRCVRFVSVLLEFKIVQLPASMRRSNRSKVGHGATFKIRLGDPCQAQRRLSITKSAMCGDTIGGRRCDRFRNAQWKLMHRLVYRRLNRGDAVLDHLPHLFEGAHLDLADALARHSELTG